MSQLFAINKKTTATFITESEVEAYADLFLRNRGYALKHRKTGVKDIDKCWPSKTAAAKSNGEPDVLVYLDGSAKLPFCVWENKSPSETVDEAIADARFYVEGLHQKKPGTPNLPRLAAGFNGVDLRLSYFSHLKTWTDVKVGGVAIVDQFPLPAYASSGISSNGNFLAISGTATANDLRRALPSLKNLYRSVTILSSGRRPIDFTVALLTLKMLVESNPDWGTWAEQPGLVLDADSEDHAIGERFKTLATRVLGNKILKAKYGDIFQFKEQTKSNEEVAFEFLECLSAIEMGNDFFRRMFQIIDELPPLHGADFDVFGEVYQAIGDDATKKALGEFFTGRHIISAVVPVLFERAGVKSFDSHMKGRTIADIACGTGGFLTEVLRYVRKKFVLDEQATRSFAAKSFFGYDLSYANASRARVNMYFAGDGFSTMDGGVDSLAPKTGRSRKDPDAFDFILTNPPYGPSSQYQRLEEAFLRKVASSLKPGAGWGLVVVPTGVLENPRSSVARLQLLKHVRVTDVISLPSHAFAPYTQQRTGILIFERRTEPLAANDWDGLLPNIENEEIAFFIVDNDGFANSDKRYDTSRSSSTGEWLHDDLKPWIEKSTGKLMPGKLYRALIQKVAPQAATNEFGDPLGEKYSCYTVKQLIAQQTQRGADKATGIELLPDTYLRPSFGLISPEIFTASSGLLLKEAKSATGGAVGGQSIREKVKQLLSARIDFSNSGKGKAKPIVATIGDKFDHAKGDQGLTEAIIYQQFDLKGIPVYGGGEAPPKFFLCTASKTKSGNPVSIHNGPALIVSMDGSSGSVRAIGKSKFVCNHHACVLKPKKSIKLDLHFVAQQIEGGLRSLASNKDGSATLTLPALLSFQFQLARNDEEMKKLGGLRKALETVRDKFR